MRASDRERVKHACARSRLVALPFVFGLATLPACGADPAPQPAPRDLAAAPAPEPVELDVPRPKPVASSMTTPTTLALPDVTLSNQRGEPVGLHSLVEGRIVVIQTMFTTCGTICPPMGASFGRLQALLEGSDDVA